MKIRQLPDTLANKIAAGEVVERPASVVKELIENSIDAQSTIIKIALKEAGLREVKVIDNGEGMEKSDCKRAFLRHATSKITFDQDLFHVKSLGFRGEALASIAAVSKLQITTSTGTSAGTQLYLEGGNFIKEDLSDVRQGTEIIVSELFYNTPARLKYMKTIHTELGHITDLINRYSLAHPDIQFDVTHNGKKVFQTAGRGNRLQVIQQIYGTQIAQNMIPIQADSPDFWIEGFIAKPEHTRANRNYMTFIVNGRYIKNNALAHAIIRAYDTLLPIHRYPIVVISITLDPILIDVNVHPTKLEIRFSKEKELVFMLEKLILETLKSISLIPKMEHKPKKRQQTEQRKLDFSDLYPNRSITNIQSGNDDTKQQHVNESTYDETIDRIELEPNTVSSIQNANPNEKKDPLKRLPTLYPIGQMHGTYILAQNEHGFYMIDQHAAQERIKYELFKKKLGQTTNDLQQLFMPLTFEFTNDEMIFIDQHLQALQEVGLFLEPFGGQTYAVKAHPSWFPQGLEEEIIRDIVSQVIQKGTISIEEIREEVAILMSCKKSIKANHYLKEDDMERLVEDLRQTADPFTCPHGRPVIIQFTNYELEKMFKRIM